MQAVWEGNDHDDSNDDVAQMPRASSHGGYANGHDKVESSMDFSTLFWLTFKIPTQKDIWVANSIP